MAVSGSPMVPGTTTGANLQAYRRVFERGTYQRMKLIPVIDDIGRIYGTGNVRKFTRVTGSALGQTADGTGLTYVSILGTPITVTAVGNHVPIAWSRNERAQIDIALDQEGRAEIEGALAELTEANAAALIQSCTQGMSVANISGPYLRKAQANLYGNTNGVAEPGVETMYGFFTHKQLPNLQEITEFNQADVRGDSENPYVKGVWTKGQGIMLLTSTVVASDGNGDHNALFLGPAFCGGWNERSTIIEDSAELQERLIAYNNVGFAVKYDTKAFYIRTTESAL